MRTPSIKTLSAVFDDAKQAKRILQMSYAELCQTDAGDKRYRECFNRPPHEDICMYVLNALEPGLFGVESIKIGSEYADYLNTGDTYAATLILWRGNHRVQSVGDFVETMERNGIRVD